MDYWIAIVCLLVGGALMWCASRGLGPDELPKLDAPVQRKGCWLWVWLVVILAYPFLSNLVRALVLCIAVLAMVAASLQRWIHLAGMGLPRRYLGLRFVGGAICFAGAAIVCGDLVREALAQKS